MNDDWRVHVRLADEGQARELLERLEHFELEHELGQDYRDRVVVSRDGAEVFLYAGRQALAAAAQRAVNDVAGPQRWAPEVDVRRWHPVAEEWQAPEEPLPATSEAVAAERLERDEEERRESAEQGYPDFEVRVEAPTVDAARELAERLRAEGIPTAQRWRFVVLGAADEDSAAALAERARREAPEGSKVLAEGSALKVLEEAPFATPFNPFSVFGGLGG